MTTLTPQFPTTWRRRVVRWAVIVLTLGLLLGIFVHRKFFRVTEDPSFSGDDLSWFKYGSLGAAPGRALPYWIWFVLPRIFPDLLPGPGGYASFGLVWEPGQEVPSGFAQSVVGYPRITNNCALCHTASYRTKEEEVPHIVVGGPGNTVDLQALLRFYKLCANDPRFNATVILQELALATRLSWIDRQIYRYVLIPRTRRALQQITVASLSTTPVWGPGRQSFSHPARGLAGGPMETSGVADAPSVWNLKIREHGDGRWGWGGEAASPLSVAVDSTHGLDAAPSSATDRAQRAVAFLETLSAPRYPFANSLDPAAVAAGREIFARTCGDCHDPRGKRTHTLIPIDEIGTDRERMRAGGGNGYLATPLDGIWLRAPYLHNGSIPTLRALLDPNRRQHFPVFYRGFDVLDPDNVGFVASGSEAERVGFKFDTAEVGNGNGGHSYGTELSAANKDALIQFLKTQ
jgi:mono/diheme cytochrome c family protein